MRNRIGVGLVESVVGFRLCSIEGTLPDMKTVQDELSKALDGLVTYSQAAIGVRNVIGQYTKGKIDVYIVGECDRSI